MTPGAAPLAGVVAWGVVVGVDFVTMPQALLSRPLVAATGAGLILGNPLAGLLAGMTLELYALDVLPIGASWYPDYSVAAVAGGTAAALGPPFLSPALAALVALPMAVLGGWSLQVLRRRNAVALAGRTLRISAGDPQALWELQRDGFLRDAARSCALAVVGVVVALALALVPWVAVRHAPWLSWAAIAGGLAAALGGAARRAGHGARRGWLIAGIALGVAAVLLR